MYSTFELHPICLKEFENIKIKFIRNHLAKDITWVSLYTMKNGMISMTLSAEKNSSKLVIERENSSYL